MKKIILLVVLFSLTIVMVSCGHEHSFSTKWQKDEINHWKVCECGEIADKALHSWDSGKVTKEATDTEEGIRTFTCTVCGATKTEKIEKTAHTHSYTWKYDEDNHWQECSCGNSTDPASHTFDAGVVTKEPTKGNYGVKTYTCSACGYQKEEQIERLATNVMSYDDFMMAEINDDVIIESYVQDFESFYNGKQTIYLADDEGAYFGYELTISEEDSNRLQPGMKLYIEGQKLEYRGQIEIGNTTVVEIIEGEDPLIRGSFEVTEDLSDEYAVSDLQGRLIEVVAKLLPSGEEGKPYLLGWNDSGELNKADLYLNIEVNDNTFTWNVRRYLRNANTDVYKAVAALTKDNIGSYYNISAYVYIYDGKCQARIVDFEPNYYYAFTNAELNDEVVIEAYVQDFESFYNGKQTMYLADRFGTYFGYELALTEELSNQITIGTKLHIEGQKLAYRGQIEIGNTTVVEIIEGDEPYIAPAMDATYVLSNELATEYLQARKIKVTAKLMPSMSGETEKPYLLNWNDSGELGKADLYLNLSINNESFTWNVRRYLRNANSDVYQAVSALSSTDLGKYYDIEAFVYIYDGQCQARIVSFMPNYYLNFVNAEINDDVVIEAYVQDFESFYNGKQTMYLVDDNGAYFGYEIALTEELSNQITIGTKLHIEGQKLEYSGMIEVGNTSKVEILDEELYEAPSYDLTDSLTDEEALEWIGAKIFVTAKLIPSGEEGKPYLLGWNDSGELGKADLYLNIEVNDNTFTWNVRRYLRNANTDLYKAVAALTKDNIGSYFDIEAFVYIYNGQCQARIVSFVPTEMGE